MQIFVHNGTIINKTRNDYIAYMLFTLYHGSLRKRYHIANYTGGLHSWGLMNNLVKLMYN